MKIKSFLQLIILFLTAVMLARPAFAALSEAEAKVWAENKGGEILQILAADDRQQKYDKLDEILHNDIDLDHGAKFVAGKYWRQMTEMQKEQYVPLFKRYMAATYKTYPLDIQRGAVRFTVDKVLPSKDTTDVFCTVYIAAAITDEAKPDGIKVIFNLNADGEKIRVRDIKVAESSLLQALRERFYKMIHQDSDDEIDWFLEDLTAIVEDTEEKNQEKLDAVAF